MTKYTLILEAESPKEIGDILYIFKNGYESDYEEQIIQGIKFDKWVSREGVFEFTTNKNEAHYSNEFFPLLEVDGLGGYLCKFYTKEGAEKQRAFRKEKIQEKLKKEIEEMEEQLKHKYELLGK